MTNFISVGDFSINKYAVTVGEFRKFAEATGYKTDAEKESTYRTWRDRTAKNAVCLKTDNEDNRPVIYVSWNDARAYCEWLSVQTGKTYRLPTAAEWEYACRAGTTTPFSTGENLTTEQANFQGDFHHDRKKRELFRCEIVPVDSFAPNAWGLYNMHGNVWEWCSEEDNGGHVIKGGSWYNDRKSCRSDFCYIGSGYSSVCGFRVCCDFD